LDPDSTYGCSFEHEHDHAGHKFFTTRNVVVYIVLISKGRRHLGVSSIVKTSKCALGEHLVRLQSNSAGHPSACDYLIRLQMQTTTAYEREI
jgi:hypothetical protein